MESGYFGIVYRKKTLKQCDKIITKIENDINQDNVPDCFDLTYAFLIYIAYISDKGIFTISSLFRNSRRDDILECFKKGDYYKKLSISGGLAPLPIKYFNRINAITTSLKTYYISDKILDVELSVFLQELNNIKKELEIIQKKEFINSVNKLREYITKYYPDNSEVKIIDISFYGNIINKHIFNKDRNVYIGSFHDFMAAALIHFPKINITNGAQTHIIRDLYVGFKIGNNNTLLPNIYALKNTFTDIEIDHRYVHSHAYIKDSDNFMCFNSMCLGDTALATSMALLPEYKIDSQGFEDLFSEVLLQLPYYLSWESIDGGPHVSMKRLLPIKGADDYYSREIAIKIINLYFTTYEDIPLEGNLYGDDYRYRIKENSNIIRQRFTELLKQIEPDLSSQAYVIIIDNEYATLKKDFNTKEVLEEHNRIFENLKDRIYFIFKGKKIELNIYRDDNEDEENIKKYTNSEKFINQYFAKSICETINYSINI